MLSPRFFKRNPVTTEEKSSTQSIHIGQIVTRTIFVFVAILVLGSVLYFVGKSVADSWREVIFAYQHPAIVRSVRVEYTQRENALNAEFANANSDNLFLKEVKSAVSQQVQQSLNFK